MLHRIDVCSGLSALAEQEIPSGTGEKAARRIKISKVYKRFVQQHQEWHYFIITGTSSFTILIMRMCFT